MKGGRILFGFRNEWKEGDGGEGREGGGGGDVGSKRVERRNET